MLVNGQHVATMNYNAVHTGRNAAKASTDDAGGLEPGFHLEFFVLGGNNIIIVCKDQLCVKHAKFFSSFLSINHQCTKKHKARVFIIRYCINRQNFWGGK